MDPTLRRPTLPRGPRLIMNRIVITSLRMVPLRAAVIACAVALAAITATSAYAAIRAEAVSGDRFGVGRVTIDLPSGGSSVPWGDDRFAILESQGRVLYPVIENKAVRRLLRNFLGLDQPLRVTFYFLFQGDDPLDITVYAPTAQRITLRPERQSRDYDKLLDDWWSATSDHFKQVSRAAEYPIAVDNFLTATWARRLGREMPEPGMYLIQRFQLGDPWISQLTANDTYRADLERDLLLGRFGAGERAEIALPPSRSPLALPAVTVPVEVEPMASHVPQECFYLRFGTYPNYLWFRDFLQHWQGDLANMIVLQSVSRDSSRRFQEQIAIRDTSIARVMGPSVIQDVAFMGFDFYLRDGAAMGIVFQAKNNLLLGRNFSEQRRAALVDHAGATEQTVKIGDHDVSFISTPDNHVRSYYAVDGDFHLITTSRRLVERFYEAGAGRESLSTSNEFQQARVAMPLSREDTIFCYASAAFVDHLSGPAYRVEVDRRLRSLGEMRALQLARLAAKAEGREAKSIQELVAADLLPKGFGERTDGSELLETDTGARDSVRGIPGWFVPVADMPVDKITRAEAVRYAEFEQGLQSQVGRFAPFSCAMRRDGAKDKESWDHITADVRIAPYSQTRLIKWAGLLGPPEAMRVAPVAGDIASAEVVVSALGQPVHLFGGLRDFHSPMIVRQGEVAPEGTMSQFVRGYVGTWPKPHLFDRIFGSPTSPFDDQGIARNDRLFDLWSRRADDFFLFSFKRDVLMEVGPQLAMVEAERPAQVRLHVDDLSDKQIATAVSGIGYMRVRATSSSGARFMNSLTPQLHVEPSEARTIAERIVDGKFDCPLGGDYELVEADSISRAAPPITNGVDSEHLPNPNSRKLWASTATPAANQFLLTEIPADYVMPLMNWFRGLSLDVASDPNALLLHADLDMVHQDITPEADESGNGFTLPSISNLLSGWGSSDEKEVKKAQTEKPGEDIPALELPPPAEK